MPYKLYNSDAFDWLESQEANILHAIVTDPPYGLQEYTSKELSKMRKGKGGVWRIPPSFDGAKRRPQPRFTILNNDELNDIKNWFEKFGNATFRVLRPGAHVIIASNSLLFPYVAIGMKDSGFEFRGSVARLVRTLRGGDRPKNGHKEFNMVSSAPRSCWEPWLIFRKPFKGTLVENLRKWETGGLQRISEETPFLDVLQSQRTPLNERRISDHPSLKPQSLMRYFAKAVLPLDRGTILDPFMGGGSTIAAAEYFGFESIGIEIDKIFFDIAKNGIPLLAKLDVRINGFQDDTTFSDKGTTITQEKLEF